MALVANVEGFNVLVEFLKQLVAGVVVAGIHVIHPPAEVGVVHLGLGKKVGPSGDESSLVAVVHGQFSKGVWAQSSQAAPSRAAAQERGSGSPASRRAIQCR